jgi:exodeoxyribonuclease VII large subunit
MNNKNNGSIPNDITSIETIYNELNSSVQKIKQTKLTGEIISNKLSDKHTYITLKSGDYQISCIGWSKSYPNIKQGTNVEVTGALGLFKKNLSIYFNVKDIKIIGDGNYLNSHAELRQKIINLGWNLNKRIIMTYPQNIAIITALEGAAIQDILQTFKIDNFLGTVYIKNTIVQGKQCPQSVIQAIDYFAQSNLQIDMLMITRGGGSYDDLVGFSDWNLLEKIHNCPLITLSAVGHQIDNQLSDEVADYKFPTPSLGAKFIVETQKEFHLMINKMKTKSAQINDKIINSKNKINYVRDNYHNIIHSYEEREMNDNIKKYKDFVNKITTKWTKVKTDFYNKLSTVKPTIFKDNEVTSVSDFINPQTNKEVSPKKIEIIFADGKVNLYYKIANYEFRQ